MKKILTLLLIVFMLAAMAAPVVLISQKLSESEILNTVSDIKKVSSSLFTSGPGWIIESWDNLLIFLFALVGLGRAIVLATPTNKDDIWFGKYVMSPLRFIGKLFSLDLKHNSP